MKKILNYLVFISLFLFFTSVSYGGDLKQSCYYSDNSKKIIADEAIDTYRLAIKEMRQASSFGDKMRSLNKSKEAIKIASSIGHPDALALECQSGMDHLAPADMRNNGEEWCKFGIETVPGLKEKLPNSFVQKISALTYTERTNTKCLTE